MVTGVDLAEQGFDAAFLRLCGAQSFEEIAVELSNMLNHLYRLSEAATTHLGGNPKAMYQRLAHTPGGAEAAAALWARNFDAHHLFELIAISDLYSDYRMDLYGMPAWKSRSQLPAPDPRYPPYGRDLLYDTSLAGRSVPDTAQVAFRALRGLLP
jgi:hypothetical protein